MNQIKHSYILFLYLLIGLSCKGQDRLDLSTIDFNVFDLPIEEKPLVDNFSIYPLLHGRKEYIFVSKIKKTSKYD